MGLSYEEAAKLGPEVAAQHPDAPGHAKAKGRRARVNGAGRNKTEQRFFEHLEALKAGGCLRGFWWEPFNLRLAPRCFFKVDAAVQRLDGSLAAVDVKARWGKSDGPHVEDDAAVKIKVVAEKYPFLDFYLACPDGAGWDVRAVVRSGFGRVPLGNSWLLGGGR